MGNLKFCHVTECKFQVFLLWGVCAGLCSHWLLATTPLKLVLLIRCRIVQSMDHDRILDSCSHVLVPFRAPFPWETASASMASTALGTARHLDWLKLPSVAGPFPLAVAQKRQSQIAYYGPVVSKRKKLVGRVLDKIVDDKRSLVYPRSL